jgi:hypothetical protein
VDFDYKSFILSLILVTTIFFIDLTVGLGAISALYVIPLLVSFWFSKNKEYIIGIIFIILVLILFTYIFQTRVVISEISVGNIFVKVDYENFFRAFSALIVIVVGCVLLYYKSKVKQFKELNETLELRILARTVASENKAKILQSQILILQGIRDDKEFDNSLSELDNVIIELKNLNKEEK